MLKVLNGHVKRGDLIAYSVRKHWDMATRIGVVIIASERFYGVNALMVRVVKSSDEQELTRMVWLYELDRVVKVKGIQ